MYIIILTVGLSLLTDFTFSDDSAMFPFGPEAGDQMVEDRSNRNYAHQLMVPEEGLVFYSRRHQHLALSNHGTLYFTDTNPAYHIGAKAPDLDSPPFAAPLYFDAEWMSNPVGIVYYRILRGDSVNPSLLELSDICNGSTVGRTTFNASYGVIATWVNITDNEGAHCAVDPDRCPTVRRSTFQAVLLANTDDTYVIFNYAKVMETAKDAQAVFYGGDFARWTPVLPSTGLSLGRLSTIQSVLGSNGRFLFKVSGDRVIRGGCSTELSRGQLMTSPNYAGMYGGEIIEVSGPCLYPGTGILCEFGDTTVAGRRLNDYKAECVVPMLKQRGRIDVSMSISTPPNFNYQTSDFTVLLPGRLEAGVTTTNLGTGQNWNESNPSSLTLHWDSEKLSTDPQARVNVTLIGYREDSNQAYWTHLVSVASNVKNSLGVPSQFGEESGLTFNPSEFRCSRDQCFQYEVGLMEVTLSSGTGNLTKSLYSHNLPLGWFIHDAMEAKHGENWPSTRCSLWDEEDKKETTWLDELPNCPCNMLQAMADFGRWQPDVGCNIFTGSRCTYHQGAVHCVRSVQPTQSGAGNQCCYSADGSLKYAADSYQGSTPDRGHAWGASPYVQPGYVPEESHWVYDVVTFYYCCLWVDYADCDKYMTRRPTRDCVNYEPSGAAAAFGDPHIVTFDGQKYLFHGNKEYILVTSGSFMLQGRFTTKYAAYSNFNVSVLTAIALRDNSDVVEIRLGDSNDIYQRELNVLVNGQHQSFVRDEMYWQDYKGVSIVRQKGDNHQRNITVLLQSGVGVQVAATSGLLNTIVSLPPHMKNGETRGLFGVWDDDRSNDFRPRDKQVSIEMSAYPQEIFVNFASTWSVLPDEMLFRGLKYTVVQFHPSFAEPRGNEPVDIQRVCGSNQACRYDYKVTGERGLAQATLTSSLWHQTLKRFLQPVETCGLLDIPYAEKDNTNYSPDSVVTVTGCRHGFHLTGETTYTCRRDSLTWSPDVSAKCHTPEQLEEAELGMKIGIGLGVAGGAALIVITIILIVVIGRRKGAAKRSQNTGKDLKLEPRVPGRSEYLPAKTTEDIEDVRPKTTPRRAKESNERV